MASIGEILEEARIRQGRTINEAAQETRISPRFIEALELDHFEDLPAPVYAKGFLRSYAAYLQLDPRPLVAAFERFTGGDGSPDTLMPAEPVPPPVEAPRSPTPDPFRRSTAAARVIPPPIITDRSLRAAPPPVEAVAAGSAEPPDGADAWEAGPPTEDRDNGGRNGGLRLMALAGGAAFIALVVFAIVALTSGGGNGNADTAAAPPASATATVTVSAAGSSTAAATSPTPTPTTKATATPTIIDRTGASPEPANAATRTATPTRAVSTSTATPTATPPPPTAQPTATPTLAPPTPTATLIPPTPTPVPPSPTPIPPTPVNVNTPSMYALCSQSSAGINCGDTANYTVICAPNGPFIDPSGSWVARAQSYGWTVTESPNPTRATVFAACG
jgi:hypothetical protein